MMRGFEQWESRALVGTAAEYLPGQTWEEVELNQIPLPT